MKEAERLRQIESYLGLARYNIKRLRGHDGFIRRAEQVLASLEKEIEELRKEGLTK